MKTNKALKKKLTLNKETISEVGIDDLKKVKGGLYTAAECTWSDNSECTNRYINCC